MTDIDIIRLIAREIAPNAYFREERRMRLGRKPTKLRDVDDFHEIKTAENKGAKILAGLREAGLIA